MVKRYNYKVKETTLSEITNRGKCLKLLRSLGYDLEPAPWLPPETWPTSRAIYRGADEQHLQVWFFEMETITQKRIYPIIADTVKTFPQNLYLFADNYDHLYFIAASATCFSRPDIGLNNNGVFPSVKVHRITRDDNLLRDRMFLEELTRTQDQDPLQFKKICHAFKRLNWLSTDVNKPIIKDVSTNSLQPEAIQPDPPELFHQLRSLLRNKRHIAYSGTWQRKVEELILPVLELLGFAIVPGKVTQKDCDSEPDFFIYRTDPEKPGATPYGGCIDLDGQCNADVFARKLLLGNMYRKMIATDGRIWRLYHDTGTSLDTLDLDLFSILKLDRERLNTPGPELETFMHLSTGRWQLRQMDVNAVDGSSTLDAIQDLCQARQTESLQNQPWEKEAIYQLLYLVYSELSGRVNPVFNERWNIPELNQICQDPSRWDNDTLKSFVVTHLKTLNELDRFLNISGYFFHNPGTATEQSSVRQIFTEASPDSIRQVIQSLNELILSFCPDYSHFGTLSVPQFAKLVGKLLQQPTPVWPHGEERAITDFISDRFKKLLRQKAQLNQPDAPRAFHLARLLSESMFRTHIIDAHAGTGSRLLQISTLLEHLFLSHMLESPDNPIHPRLPELRKLIIRDSHENKVFLNHSNLTDIRLMRLQICQHCLYGVIDAGELRVIPSVLNLSTDLSGIRFPFTSHHFHPATSSARDRLNRTYAGELPQQIQAASSALNGMIAAARWFAEQELDLEAFGPNFAFTRAQFRMIIQRVIDFNDEHPDEQDLPLEFVFAWIFYNRLSGSANPGEPGTGFDRVII